MINLIPPNSRKAVTREYWIRVVTIWMFLGAFALLVIAALGIPTFVLINTLNSTLAGEVDNARIMEEAYNDSEKVIKDANALIRHLKPGVEPVRFSELIYELDNIAGNDVRLTQFAFQESDKEQLSDIAIAGVALTRESLSEFRDNLEAHPFFESVELPISNLVKDRDITFSMIVSVVKKDKQ